MSPKERLERKHSTDNFPIQLRSETEDWKYLTIATESKEMLTIFTTTKATAHLLGSRRHHRSVGQEIWMKRLYDAVAVEATYIRNKTPNFKNVKVECVCETKFSLVKIKFASIEEAENMNDSFAPNNLTLRNEIEGPLGLPLTPAVVDKYVTQTGRTEKLTCAVVNYATHADYVLQ